MTYKGMRIHQTNTLNQFKFDGGKGKTACVPICIQALYHLHDALQEGQLLTPQEWCVVMERGAKVWQLWREQYPHLKTPFPRIEEIIGMKECEGFYQLFNTKSDEFDGLIMDSQVIENGQGPLTRVIKAMVAKSKTHTSCAVVILPGHYAVALISYCGSVLLFDPHGKAATNTTELLQFPHTSEVVPYMINRYRLSSVDDVVDKPLFTLYDEEEIQNQFGYSATVFTTK